MTARTSNNIRPTIKNNRTSLRDTGVGQSRTALIFFGSEYTPSFEMTWPKKDVGVCVRRHLEGFSLRLAKRSFLKNKSSRLRCSSSDLLKTTMSSKYSKHKSSSYHLHPSTWDVGMCSWRYTIQRALVWIGKCLCYVGRWAYSARRAYDLLLLSRGLSPS